LRVSAGKTEKLVGWIRPDVQKQDTTVKITIPVAERLLATMYFLATNAYTVLTSSVDTVFQ
jgi:hypothetical protein